MMFLSRSWISRQKKVLDKLNEEFQGRERISMLKVLNRHSKKTSVNLIIFISFLISYMASESFMVSSTSAANTTISSTSIANTASHVFPPHIFATPILSILFKPIIPTSPPIFVPTINKVVDSLVRLLPNHLNVLLNTHIIPRIYCCLLILIPIFPKSCAIYARNWATLLIVVGTGMIGPLNL